MIRVAICDDNSIFVKDFKKNVTAAFLSHNLAIDLCDYTSGRLLLNNQHLKSFDVIFLDIDMPKLNGFDIASSLKDENGKTLFVFVTNHNELVYDSFMFQPLNFITKGNTEIIQQRLDTVVEQIKEHIIQQKTIILENGSIGRTSVKVSDIIYIESSRHNVIFHIKSCEDPITVPGSISVLENEYSDLGFVRIHKRYLVNMAHLFNINISKEYIEFKNHSTLPVSRNYKHRVNEEFTLYLRKRS